jgi:hypothetical protein
MGHFIEVVKAPNTEKRFLVCVPANVYGGLKTLQFTTMVGASQRIGARDWTGKMSADLSKRIFEDMTESINRGEQPEWMQSIRVTQYRSSTEKPVVVVWPREEERAAEEPVILPVAQATDGAWRLVPTTGFAKRLRGWEYQGAFVDSSNEGRTILVVGDTQLECVMRLFGSLNPVTQEFVRTFPFADPKDIPTQAVRALGDEDEYVPTQAELDAVPALEIAYCDSLSAAEMKRLNLFDWKFREGYRKRMILDAQADRERAEIFKREKEAEDRKAERKRMLADDADKKRKGDL